MWVTWPESPSNLMWPSAPRSSAVASGRTLSFGLIFVVLGTSAGLIGGSLFRLVPFARQAAGLLVIGVGVLMTGVFGPVLSRFGWQPPLERLPAGRSAHSVSLGALFALGWSPCIRFELRYASATAV